MSGRLRISGKKSYCPWKASNVQRVQQDEQQAREQQQRETQHEAQALQTQKWDRIRHRSSELGGSPASASPPNQHVNLFAKEEREASEVATAEEAAKQATANVNRYNVSSTQKIFPDSASASSSSQFQKYTRDNATATARSETLWGNMATASKKERETKQRLDPMQPYHHRHQDENAVGSTVGPAHAPYRSNRHSRRHVARTSRKKDQRSRTTTSIEELRQKRRKRERIEKARLEKECL